MAINSRNKGVRGTEEWKDISGYEGLYQVSTEGRIKSIPRITNGIVCNGGILKQSVNNVNGYCYVKLYKNGKGKTMRVHCIVMNTFMPVNKKYGFDPQYTINHIDGNKQNNCLPNLEWCSQSDNQKHAYVVGLEKITWSKKVICLDNHKIFNSIKEAGIFVGGKNGGGVAKVCKGIRSHYRNFHFAFLDDFINGTIPHFVGKFTKRSSVGLWR